ncbi:MAG TPA: dockerin type I domain-containing protein [Tepidisphaeraceae bacterium]|nr:dockerin type I domain-containing protein [Tepidisphaeraceae bacterium]
MTDAKSIVMAILLAAAAARAQALISTGTSLRIASYNIDDSDQGNNNNVSQIAAIIQGIGSHQINGSTQPVDVIGLEELLDTNNNSIISTTLPALVNDLNSLYGAGTYAYVNVPDPTTGGTSTNGPSGLIYNTHTVQIISTEILGYKNTGADSIPRAPMRFEIRPIGYNSNADFYMYVSHAKSGSTSSDTSTRNAEATEIRADADALGPNAHILYTGDYNIYGDSSEPSYLTITGSGNGQGFDPADPTETWTADAAHVAIETESAKNVEYRDDVELTSGEVYNPSGSTSPGLQLASSGGVNSYIVFGNGSSPSVPPGGTAQSYNHTVNYSGNKTLSDLSNASTILSDLTTATDHLPIVADYNIMEKLGDASCDGVVDSTDLALLENGIAHHLTGWSNGDFNGDGVINSDDFALFSLGLAQYNATAPVPEPADAASALILTGMVLARRRKCALH